MKNKLFSICLLGFLYLNLSCFCKGPRLSQTLIDSSSVIFEGTVDKVDILDEEEYEVSITFKVLKQFKGDLAKTIVVKSTKSSCGFFFKDKEIAESIGRKFLMYCCKENGIYGYHYCSDRRVRFPLKRDYKSEYTSKSESVTNYSKRKMEYKNELVALDSIIRKF